MSAPITVVAAADDGAHVEIALPDAASLAELERRWPPLGLARVEVSETGADDGAGHGGDGASGPDARLRLGAAADTAAWDRLESDLGLFAAERVAGLVAVHAGLAVVDGLALVLPGRSHAGKTTLTLALGAAGARIASDEYALVDTATGLVHGWPRPARVRLAGGSSRREPVAADVEPVPVGMVALLRYDAGVAGVLDLTSPSRADAVVAILDETVCARSRPDASLDAALALTVAPVVRGRRGEADAVADALIARLRGGSA